MSNIILAGEIRPTVIIEVEITSAGYTPKKGKITLTGRTASKVLKGILENKVQEVCKDPKGTPFVYDDFTPTQLEGFERSSRNTRS